MMLRELLSVFRSDDPLARLGHEFSEMLSLGRLITVKAGGHFFEGTLTRQEDLDLHEEDRKINDLQRVIRKAVVTHLTLGLPGHQIPYALLIMSLADEAEQIGDHALALAGIRRDLAASLSGDDPVMEELRTIRRSVERAFAEVDEVFAGAESTRARELIEECRDLRVRAEGLFVTVAQGDYSPPQASALVVASGHYARIAIHLTQILAGVVLPLHELNLYEEDQLGQFLEQQQGDDGSD
jgi:phosphate uptake regulator